MIAGSCRRCIVALGCCLPLDQEVPCSIAVQDARCIHDKVLGSMVLQPTAAGMVPTWGEAMQGSKAFARHKVTFRDILQQSCRPRTKEQAAPGGTTLSKLVHVA